MLNNLVYDGLSHVSGHHSRPLMDCAVRCLHLLYERDCTHPFCPPDLWFSPARKSIAVAARTHEVLSANLRSDGFSASLSVGFCSQHCSSCFPFGREAGLKYGELSKELLTAISKAAFAPELTYSLMQNYDGDVKDLSLDFTITEESLGERFLRYTRMQLLSGGSNYDIDIDDLKNNTCYTGGYEGVRMPALNFLDLLQCYGYEFIFIQSKSHWKQEGNTGIYHISVGTGISFYRAI
ncbi:hypothetical protein VNO77_02124 [Canavalia gladiata]|uniref:HECT-type E3 ubiquitin transferase n=1 Tax=Canavalia gladiata TaxID=3824 RepID=A0AAN9MSE5_CANGL